jgi:hypothetical protein
VAANVFDRALAVLERRFFTNAFLPVLLFAPAVATPILLQDGRLSALVRTWDRQSGTLKLLETGGYLAVVWFAAAIVASQWSRLTKLLEGYSVRRLGPVRSRAVEWHKARRAALERSGRAARLLHDSYPSAERVLPTRLGNILRAAEEYPRDRYGFPQLILWSRLYPVLKPDFAANLEAVRARMEFLHVVCAWCAAFAVGSLGLGIAFGSAPLLVAWCFVAGMGFAHAAYVSSLPAALEYGDRLKAAYELHRFDLMRILSLKTPRTLTEEKRLWTQFVDFVVLGERMPAQWQREWMYRDAPAPEAVLRLVVELHAPE